MPHQLSLFPEERTLKIKQIIKRSGHVAEFDPEKISYAIFKAAVHVEGCDQELAKQLTLKVLAFINQIYPTGSLPTVEEIQDLVEKVLIENGHARTAKAYILYRAERARIREKKELAISVEDNIPYKLLWKHYAWNVDHHCHTIEELNRQMKSGEWKKLVNLSESKYHDEINKVVQQILKRKNDLRIMIIAGPSSSGKTTTTIKIGDALKSKGISFVTLNMDHYFKNLEEHPKDEHGDYDFEGPQALDLGLIGEHLRDLIHGKRVRIPYFDFKSGKRREGTQEIALRKNEIILIDSLHGLYPNLTEVVPNEQKFKFYIEAICQIKDSQGNFVRWTDLRMLRRMIRDSHQRNYEPHKTVGHWHYVRRAEKKYIVPYVKSADYLFNGSLPYELPVYKHFLERLFPTIIEHYEKDPKKIDAFIRAKRVYKLLQSLEQFPNINSIPANSLIREFIGGGIYKY